MYHDSGPFPRESALSSGFAGRRMERWREPGAAAPGVWRSPGGAVLRLPSERLATLAAEVRAAAHPAHPAAADPRTAVRQHVAALARAARPAGTVADRATGRTLHVFRAPGRAGEMEIVTAPPRGVLFDIMEVRPAATQGELEVYQTDMPGAWAQSRSGERIRVRGARAKLKWAKVPVTDFVANPDLHSLTNVVYIVTRDFNLHDPDDPAIRFELPRYVGIARDLAERWAERVRTLEVFNEGLAGYWLWVSRVDADPSQVRTNATGEGVRARLLREDVEHVLIRRINNDIPAAVLQAVLRTAYSMQPAEGLQLMLTRLTELGAFPPESTPQEEMRKLAESWDELSNQQFASAQQRRIAFARKLEARRVKLALSHLRLKNERSVAPYLSDQHGGVQIVNEEVEGYPRPWFLLQDYTSGPGEEFEIPADAGALAGAI